MTTSMLRSLARSGASTSGRTARRAVDERCRSSGRMTTPVRGLGLGEPARRASGNDKVIVYIDKEKTKCYKMRMAHDVISICPVCSGELAVTRLHCRSCGTTLEGEFSVGRFGRLSREQVVLLESFLRSRGNLRDMERELGISYPTVRTRVEALVRALGFGPRNDDEVEADAGDVLPDAADGATGEPGEPGVAASRESILEALARHEISAEDAATAIRGLGKTPR